jgi:hypothetical protein
MSPAPRCFISPWCIKAAWRRFLDTYEPLRRDLYRSCPHLSRSLGLGARNDGAGVRNPRIMTEPPRPARRHPPHARPDRPVPARRTAQCRGLAGSTRRATRAAHWRPDWRGETRAPEKLVQQGRRGESIFLWWSGNEVHAVVRSELSMLRVRSDSRDVVLRTRTELYARYLPWGQSKVRSLRKIRP